MLLARLPNDLSNLRFLHFLHLLIWLILCTTECSMNWMGNDLVKQVTLHLLLEKTRDDPTVFLCQFKVQANTEHDKQNNDSMSFFQTTLPHCQRAVSAALTKHSMSRWAASPMAITGAAPDAIRCEWCNNSGCVCNGEMSLIWHIDMIWCHPDVILMSSWCPGSPKSHRHIALYRCPPQSVHGDLVFHASQTCQPKNQRGLFSANASRTDRNAMEWFRESPS